MCDNHNKNIYLNLIYFVTMVMNIQSGVEASKLVWGKPNCIN
jgi:hypothetical protein